MFLAIILHVNLKVVFVGEDGVDQGGLLRELWNLLEMKFKDKYFEGNRDEVIPMHDMVALQVGISMFQNLTDKCFFQCSQRCFIILAC